MPSSTPHAHSRHSHAHRHLPGPLGWLQAVFHVHGHADQEQAAATDAALKTREGICTVWIALALLGLTTLAQVVIVAWSGSVALLADTVHNLGDALNSIPLLAAFYLARRAATRRYTYGFGRAEDLAGLVIVLSIVFSAGFILWESARKLIDPQPIAQTGWVAAAAVIGFVGNEAVALYQIRTGNRIGSEALIADGLHARIDGLTSLVVLVAVAGSLLGAPIVDPIVGLLIGVTIVFIARDAARRVWYRLMDAVDPALIDQIEQYASEIPGVQAVTAARARWNGHQLTADVGIRTDPDLDAAQLRQVNYDLRSRLTHMIPVLASLTIDLDDLPAHGNEITPEQDPVWVKAILPDRYRDSSRQVSAAPMGAAALKYDDAGDVAWDEMWTGFCELALAGGAPHRGTLLEPVHAEAIAASPARYEAVLQELERGLAQVTRLPVVRSQVPGWIGLACTDEEMAIWLLRAIVVENVSCRREGAVLWFPAGPDFRIEREIKNVITVVAKTTHYWKDHIAGGQVP